MGVVIDSNENMHRTNVDPEDRIASSTIILSSTSISAPSPTEGTKEALPIITVPASNDTDQLGLPIEQDFPRPFDSVSSDLAALGALSVEDFLSNVTSSTAVFDVNFYVQLPEAPASQDNEKEGEDGGVPLDASGQTKADEQRAMRSMVAMLHDASNKVFGSSDCMKFEYMEEDAKNKQCILTITHPNGATRSYKSDPSAGFTRRQDARMQAAKLAVEMGAIDFIISGDSDALKAKKGLLLNPFDVEIDNEMSEVAPGMSKYTEEEEPLKLIEDACTEWRASKVKPHWVTYNDSKNKKKHGAALRISLNAHVFRAYSVDPVYSYQKLAKLACARAAMKEGVIDFIQYGNGQTQPAKLDEEELEEGMIREFTPPPPPKGVTLQEFFETLPRPFPEEIGDVTANDFNAPAWLNLILQSARGARLVSSYTPIVDGIRHLHGCILRIERPGETRTFLVDPQLPKRSDARSAVCLLAMSQGVGNYIRGLKEDAENRLPAARRKLANEKLLQVLSYECSKVKPGNRLIFSFASERDAFGCTLKVDISPNVPDVREYTVKTEYRNKGDAKAAIACLAAEQGLVDLLRFRGEPPPSDYVPFWEAQVYGNGDYYVAKRKDRDREFDGDAQDRKRRKGNFRDKESAFVSGDVGSKFRFKVKNELPSDGAFLFRKLPPTGPSGWKKPRVTASSSGLGPTNGYANTSRTVGQDWSESRNSGTSGSAYSPERSVPHPPTAPRAFAKLTSARPNRSSSYDPQRVIVNGSQFQSPYSHSCQIASEYSASAQPDPHSQSEPYSRSDYAHSTSYSQPSSYLPEPYAHPDPYGTSYPTYPPPVVGYPVSAYPTPPPPPPPPHAYATYYTVSPPPPHPPPPSAASYGHYTHSPQYLPHYPSGHYAAYPHPVQHQPHYSSPPPPTHLAMPVAYPVSMPPSNPPPPLPPGYASGYHTPYSPPYSPLHTYSRSPSHLPHGMDYEYHNHHRRHDHTQGGDPYYGQNGYHDQGGKPRSSPGRGSYPPSEVRVKQEPADDSQLLPSEPPPPPNSNLAALYEFCQKGTFPKPKFMFEITKDEAGEKKFKVWAEQYSQRLELPTLFSNYEEGRDKLAKRVLNWMRNRN